MGSNIRDIPTPLGEQLDLCNVIEIKKIREVLIHHPDLLSMFELLILVCNKRINEEKVVRRMPIEPYEEPDLESDSSGEVSD